MRYFILIVLLIGFVSAVDVGLNCPDEIFAGEEFECSVEISDGGDLYDLKIEIDRRSAYPEDLNSGAKKRNSVLEIWDSGEWKSSYYYLKEFIEDEEDVKLRISEEGRYDVIVKLRIDDWREEFDVGQIEAEEGEVEEVEIESEDAPLGVPQKSELGGKIEIEIEDVPILKETHETELISLSNNVEETSELVYISKDGKIVDWLPYGFCIFLLLLVCVLLWDKF